MFPPIAPNNPVYFQGKHKPSARQPRKENGWKQPSLPLRAVNWRYKLALLPALAALGLSIPAAQNLPAKKSSPTAIEKAHEILSPDIGIKTTIGLLLLTAFMEAALIEALGRKKTAYHELGHYLTTGANGLPNPVTSISYTQDGAITSFTPGGMRKHIEFFLKEARSGKDPDYLRKLMEGFAGGAEMEKLVYGFRGLGRIGDRYASIEIPLRLALRNPAEIPVIIKARLGNKKEAQRLILHFKRDEIDQLAERLVQSGHLGERALAEIGEELKLTERLKPLTD